MSNEVWKEIPGYEGYYSVSNAGIVRRDKGYKNTFSGKIMKLSLGLKGYYYVCLSKKCVHKSYLVHKIVALTFIGERPIGFEINHKNGIKTDNTSENLEYCTHSQNVRHAFRMGLSNQKGEKNNFSKFKDHQILEARNMLLSGKTYRQVVKITGISKPHLRDIKSGEVWKHLTNASGDKGKNNG